MKEISKMSTSIRPTQFNRDEETPLHQQVREHIRAQCLTLGPNTALASVREICEQLGVNPGTVTRALRDLESDGLLRIIPRKGTYVAPEPEATVELLSLCGEPESLGAVAQRFLAGMKKAYRGAEAISSTTLSSAPYPDPKKMSEVLRLRQIRGLVISGHDYQPYSSALQETNFLHGIAQELPVVLVGKPHRFLKLDCVYTDARPEMLEWMNRCLDNGITRFGYIRAMSDAVHYNERFETFRQFHLDRRLSWHSEYIPEDPGVTDQDEAERIKVVNLLETNPLPQAVVMNSATAAYIFILEALRRGIKPGEDVHLLTFTGDAYLMHALQPYVTQILLLEEEMGMKAMDRIQERLSGTGPGEPQVLRLPAVTKLPSPLLN